MSVSNHIINDDGSIEITEGRYKGIVYTYGRVQLIEDPDDDALIVRFEYNLNRGVVEDPIDFRDCIGPILYDMISQGIMNNSIVYTGGV